ncbi:hypothetical protein [Tautonia plasticadhaerens]|uniref:Flagellar MS-ring protein n=1 Tax=Tautonia plasticadhaerens TaxID=2527974 RepID=A0A518HCV0_9BACT|nr:hypothetical protein [Tautonia plasticadhaerens]QDV38689.1 flagellar MS-ring protein [Tautonia plasticadhaerens]
MRIEDREAVGARPAPAIGKGRLADRLGPIGRWFRDRRGASRRAAALAVASALAAAAGMALVSPESPRVSWLDNGRSFAPDELEALDRALAIKGIGAEPDDRGRLGVSPDREAEALKVLEQEGLARRPLSREFADPLRPGILADARERAQVVLTSKAAKIRGALERIPGLLSAEVELHPGPSRPFADPEPARAGIRLTADRDRAISPDTVGRVLNVVTAFTGLEAKDVTIIDAKGDALLKAGDDRYAQSMQAEARARGWEAAIAEELGRSVEGVRVEVTLEGPPGPSPRAPGPTAAREEPEAPRWTAVAVVPNGPMSLARPAPPRASPPTDSEGPGAVAPRAKVLVEVPAGYYLARHDAFADGKQPRREVLDRFVSYTEDYVRRIVTHVIPEESRGPVQILMGPLPPEPAEHAPRAREARGWPEYWWAPAVIIGVGAALALLASAGGWLPGLRPPPGSAPAAAEPPRPHLPDLRDDDAPGPADRVRELVRRDPSAAAAVLRRWVEQGVDA